MSQMSFTDLFSSDPAKSVVTTQKTKQTSYLTNHIAEFVKVFNGIGRQHNRYDVFRDFITASSLSIENVFLKSNKLEDDFKTIQAKYSSEDMKGFSHLLGILVMGLEVEMCDFLGKVFMNLDFGSSHLGQFFTPFHVSELMAGLILGDMAQLETQPYITLNEPTCGAGGMVIASAKQMRLKGYNPQNCMLAICVDIDPVAARMCYIQLSYLGIPAIVSIGNSLSLKVSHVMHTPFYHLNRWKFEK